MYLNGSELRVIVKNRPIDEYQHKGKNYIEGRRGSDYVIQYRNNSSKRQKIIVSVDGLNVMTGDNTWERGYVVDPYQTFNIPGWRKDFDNVAAFNFGSVKASYNQHNESGDAQNIGVIGVRVYNEVIKWTQPKYELHYHYWPDAMPGLYPLYSQPQPRHYWTFNNADFDINSINIKNISASYASASQNSGGEVNSVNCMRSSNPVSERTKSRRVQLQPESGYVGAEVSASIGTGWGENKDFKTVTVNYDFEKNVHATLMLFYDDLKGLKRRGINIKEKVYPQAFPNAFPDGCPPPR